MGQKPSAPLSLLCIDICKLILMKMGRHARVTCVPIYGLMVHMDEG